MSDKALLQVMAGVLVARFIMPIEVNAPECVVYVSLPLLTVLHSSFASYLRFREKAFENSSQVDKVSKEQKKDLDDLKSRVNAIVLRLGL